MVQEFTPELAVGMLEARKGNGGDLKEPGEEPQQKSWRQFIPWWSGTQEVAEDRLNWRNTMETFK